MVIEADSLPARVDLRPLLLSVCDQGARGTCLAFAVTAAHEARRAADEGVLEDLAEEVLYWGCRQLAMGWTAGATFLTAAHALSHWGQPTEEFWPYDGSRDDASSDHVPPHGALDPAVCHKADLRSIPATWSAIQVALARGQTVALGVRVGPSFQWTNDGRIELPATDKELGDGHAILVVGYEHDQTLIFRNSWGAEWGDHGYGYLPYAYLERFGAEAWVVEIL